MTDRQFNWERDVPRILSFSSFAKIHKIGSIENGWFILSYKDKKERITPENNLVSIYNICRILVELPPAKF